MFSQFKTLPQLFDYFKDDTTCLAYWEQVRWGGKVTCPHCGAEKPYKTNRGYKCTNVECQKKFSALVGSIMENTKIPMRTWFGALYLCSNHKKGISSLQLSRDLGIHQKSAWFLLHRIRESFKETDAEKLGGEGVIVEVDETYVGGKVKNMSNKKRKAMKENMQSGFDNKTVVMGYAERSGAIRFEVVCKECDMQEMVRTNVDTTSILSTDSSQTYKVLGQEFAHHGIVDHGKKEYVKDEIFYTNTLEGGFSLLDRMITGIYHYVSPKHLQAYCNENAYRYNTRKTTEPMRFQDAMSRFNGKRLKYAILTK